MNKIKQVRLAEHHGQFSEDITELVDIQKAAVLTALKNGPVEHYFAPDKKGTRSNKDRCFYIDKVLKNQCRFTTSFFVGVDWIDEKNKLSLCVSPKIEHLDFIQIFCDVLSESENLKHLDNLYEIQFDKPSIEIDGTEVDYLSPLLVFHYLFLLKQIVRKGLKKSYYRVTKNLTSRVKGKILVPQTIKQQKLQKIFCSYDEFGLNCDENKVLKKAVHFARSFLAVITEKPEVKQALKQISDYILAAFESVSDDVDIRSLKSYKPNPLFKEYNQALKIARFILKRYSYNIINIENTTQITPPFWINMPKLFELYVFKKLREIFPTKDDVTYHHKTDYREIDFLIKPLQIVADTKYKPKWEDERVIEDIRQVSAYARMDDVYTTLQVEATRLIDCLVIYSIDLDGKLPSKDISSFIFDRDKIKIEENKIKGYKQFYKIGIKLPEI